MPSEIHPYNFPAPASTTSRHTACRQHDQHPWINSLVSVTKLSIPSSVSEPQHTPNAKVSTRRMHASWCSRLWTLDHLTTPAWNFSDATKHTRIKFLWCSTTHVRIIFIYFYKFFWHNTPRLRIFFMMGSSDQQIFCRHESLRENFYASKIIFIYFFFIKFFYKFL